jgi:hypothetical protein
MKKKLALVLAAVATLGFAQADAQVYQKGAALLNVGVGLGAGYGGGLPIGVALDYGVTKNISLGAQVDYLSWTYGGYGGDYKYRFIPVGIRGAYHFDGVGDPNKIDLYLGLVLGYWVSSFTAPNGVNTSLYSDAYKGKLLVGGIAGGRYMFTPKVGAFAELGYSVSYGKVGVTFKF